MEGFSREVQDLIRERLAVLEGDAGLAKNWLDLGLAYEAHGLLDLALPCYETSVELRADDPKAWYRLALTRAQLGDFSRAIVAIDHTLTLAKTYLPAWLKRGAWQVELGEYAAAEASYGEALKLAPEDTECALGQAQLELARGNAEHALQLLADPMHNRGPNAAFVQQVRGHALARLGRTAEAEIAHSLGRLARPLANDPWSMELFRNQRGQAQELAQASILLAQGRVEDALARLRPLHDANPNDERVIERLASAYEQSGKVAEARALLEQLIVLEPKDALAYVRMAALELKTGLFARALRVAESALQVDARCPEAHAVQIRAQLGLGELQVALDAWRQAQAIGLADSALAVEIGKAAMQVEQMDSALAAFRRATELDAALTDAWIGVAIGEHAFGATEAARTALARARTLDPQHSMVPILEAEFEKAPVDAGSSQSGDVEGG